ncbi:MAG: T9SS type A sorting domain-containing protein, partial [Flavobacteriaceae bacterium]|nr:T9SS type A sorting domain-containing protein [Flavobacteriaceae bacterium]
FVNQCGLDSATNVLYSNGTSGATYRIYRWAINPTGPSITKSTISNTMLNTVPTYFTASPYTADRVLVGTALGKIIRLNNASGTPSWTDISMPGQVGAVSDIRYGASENEIMVTFHNYGVNNIWYTTNGASGSPTWVSKEGNLPDMPVKCILQNPLNTQEVIIGTELGVWKTSDWNSTNPTWVQSQNGMSDVKVLSFDYRSADNTILAATFGRGMFTGTFETATCASYTTFESGSWNNGAPSTTKAAIIYQNYDTAVSGNIDACTLRITEGNTVTVRAGDYIKIEGDINIDGTLIIEHEGSVVQTDSNALVTNNGTINVLLDTPNLASRDFMILGSPMTGEDRSSVWNSAFLVLDATTGNFVPHPDVTIQFPGAENFADDNNDFWQAYSGSINPGEGYLVRPQSGYGQPGGVFNYTYDDGTLNNGTVNFNVVYNTPGPTAADNKNASPNVLSNPYPSSIFADDFINANTMVDEVYFWEHLTPPSTSLPGAGSMNFSMEDISMYNLTGGTAAASDPGTSTQPNGYISTGQGFGIKATSGGTAVFTNAMRRTTNNNTLRNNSDRDRIWLRLANTEYEMQKTTLIGFTENATAGFDNGYDSRRLATVVSLYSHLEDGSQELGIQSREAFESGMKVPMGFSTQIEANLDYEISIENIEGANLEAATVYLIDNKTATIHNLSEGAYTFESDQGTFHNRFTLQFEAEVILGVGETALEAISLFPNPTTGTLNIVSPQEPIEAVVIYDVQGRKVAVNNYNSNRTIQVDVSSLEAAMYFVTIHTEIGILTKRVIKE